MKERIRHIGNKIRGYIDWFKEATTTERIIAIAIMLLGIGILWLFRGFIKGVLKFGLIIILIYLASKLVNKMKF